MNLRYFSGVLVFTLGCSARVVERVDERKVTISSITPAKKGTEQTEGPSVSADERQYPPETMERPLPLIQFQPLDMTSALSADAELVISVRDSGNPIDTGVLAALQKEVALVALASGAELPVDIKVVNTGGGAYAENGYPRAPSARIAVSSKTPLAEGWYAITIKSLPPRLRLPEFGSYSFPGRGFGARFAIGSAPSIASIRACEKSNARSVIIVDFSERVVRDDALLRGTQFRGSFLAGQTTGCVVDLPESDSGTTKLVRFVCEHLDPKARHQLLTDPNVRSADGAYLGASGEKWTRPNTVVPRAIDLDLTQMKPWGQGCVGLQQ